MKTSSLLFIFILIYSCGVFKERRNSIKYDSEFYSCWDNIKFNDLERDTTVRVLLFIKYIRLTVNPSPNQIIGVLNNKDTVALLDIAFRGEIKTNSTVRFKSRRWTNDEKEINSPYYTIFPPQKNNDNKIMCAVKAGYYGEIDTAFLRSR